MIDIKLLPVLKSIKTKTMKHIYAFGGINRRESFSAGELEKSENISFDLFPSISAGRERKTAPAVFKNGFTYIPVDGGVVAYKFEEEKGLTLGYVPEKENAVFYTAPVIPDATEKERYAAKLGNYIVLFPDKLCAEADKISSGFKPMEKTLEYAEDGNKIFYDSIKFTNREKYRDFANNFKVGDAISACEFAWYYENSSSGNYIQERKLIVRELSSSDYRVIFDPNSFPELQREALEFSEITFKKTVPDITNLVSFEGRVWGNDAEGKIYASKYNDPTNFEYFDSSSADSFTLETGTTGEFTASGAGEGYVAFFKEDKIHRITGTKPSNFRHTVLQTKGVLKGAEKTLCLKDGIFYYMSKGGVCVFDGGDSEVISDALSDLTYKSGAAVFYKDTYYISINDGSASSLYGYDTKKGMWLSDGGEFFENAFLYLGMPVYKDGNGAYKYLGDSKDLSRDISVTFREITEDASEQKGWSRLYITARISKGGRIKAEIDYGFGFETAGVFTDCRKTVFEIRLKPNRGDKIRLRLTASPDTVITKLMREHYVHGSVF